VPCGLKGERRPVDVIGNAVKVMRIATGEEAETPPADDGKDPDLNASNNEWRREQRRQGAIPEALNLQCKAVRS
jgi:hypothetical protein